MKAKKIGVLGSGMVGKVLASGFIKHGFEVMIGS
jgi:predicted dinucleotide-binding enzyme